jgi:predicted RNA binding protein YcfA (HicA-like mRNA interferase family)
MASKFVLSHDQTMKVRDVILLLKQDGWFEVRTRGSHRQYRHATKQGTVTIAGKLGTDVPIGTLRAILKQAGLERE